jgi:hypothetical protein
MHCHQRAEANPTSDRSLHRPDLAPTLRPSTDAPAWHRRSTFVPTTRIAPGRASPFLGPLPCYAVRPPGDTEGRTKVASRIVSPRRGTRGTRDAGDRNTTMRSRKATQPAKLNKELETRGDEGDSKPEGQRPISMYVPISRKPPHTRFTKQAKRWPPRQVTIHTYRTIRREPTS